MVFTRAKVAVWIDGCYWHACPLHGRRPTVNAGYWGPKLERNVARDRAYDIALQAEGWTVLRIWEHEEAEEAASRVVAAVAGRAKAGRGVVPRDGRHP